jgi:hypothetical protein
MLHAGLRKCARPKQNQSKTPAGACDADGGLERTGNGTGGMRVQFVPPPAVTIQAWMKCEFKAENDVQLRKANPRRVAWSDGGCSESADGWREASVLLSD